MFDESGKGTLDTLKEILNDINDHCHMKDRENDMHSGNAILAIVEIKCLTGLLQKRISMLCFKILGLSFAISYR